MKLLCNLLAIIGFSLTFAIVSVLGQASTAPVSRSERSDSAPRDAILFRNEDGKQQNLSFTEINKLKRVTVKASDHGKAMTFEGFALADILKLAGEVFGDSMRGKRMSTFLLVEAADNYRAVFALPEIDPGFTDRIIILADRRDGQPLSKEEGPWRVVAPDDKRGNRWVRQVTGLKIIKAQD